MTGNPVRSSLRYGDAARGLARFGFSDDLPLLYVTGGARGASPLNQRVAALLPDILQVCQILHQTGPATANNDLKTLEERRAGWSPALQQRYRPVEFIRDELADVYAAADLVLGRAGAGTVAELTYLGKPGLLIPLPGSGGGEQDANALTLADAGAAVILAQHEATPERLRADVERLLADPERLTSMGEHAAGLARRDAAERLANELLALAGRT